MQEITIKVQGMHCEGCEKRIKNSLSQIEGIEEVIANYNENKVTIKSNQEISKEEIREIIEDLGFEIVED